MLNTRNLLIPLLPLALLVLTYYVRSERRFEMQLRKVIQEQPNILAEGLKASPREFSSTLAHAIELTREELERKRAQEEQRRFEAALDRPLKPLIREDELVRGPVNAPLTLVAYADFACPLSARSFHTVQALLETYKGRLRVVYKHLPHEMHANALISAKYYEALRLQSEKLAMSFHDQLFQNQTNLRKGESFLKHTANTLGANMSRLAHDINSKEVESRIEQDIDEAHAFGIQGTPAFLLNGIPITGAYPEKHFEALIEKLENRSFVAY